MVFDNLRETSVRSVKIGNDKKLCMPSGKRWLHSFNGRHYMICYCKTLITHKHMRQTYTTIGGSRLRTVSSECHRGRDNDCI